MIYHIVKENEYFTGNDGKHYLPLQYKESGFVHCAFEPSVIPVANDYYLNVEGKLLLLRIDPSKLNSQIKYEPPSPEGGVRAMHVTSSPVFPHVYGPIHNSAVDGVGVLVKENNGYIWPEEFMTFDEYMSTNQNVLPRRTKL